MGGGGGGGSEDIRAQENERNARQQSAIDAINAIFSGTPAHKRGVGPTTTDFAPGQTYYDEAGNAVMPVSAKPQIEPHTVGGLFGGLFGGSRNQPKNPLYTGYEDVPQVGGFNDAYYKNIADAYMDFQKPLLEEQIDQARRKLPMTVTSTGSSAYQRKAGNLERDYERAQVDLASKAQDVANQQRQQVEQNRSDLIGLANAGTDAASLAAQSSARSAALNKPPAFSPIADLFAKYMDTGAQLSNANLLANQIAYQNAGGPTYFGAPRSAVRMVG